MQKTDMKKILLLLCPIIALVFELLPYGAVLIYAPSPTETIRKTYSYFSLVPFGYANFAPLLTGILTCIVFLIAIAIIIKGNHKQAKLLSIISFVSMIVSLMPLVYGIDYFSVSGGIITVAFFIEGLLALPWQLKP